MEVHHRLLYKLLLWLPVCNLSTAPRWALYPSSTAGPLPKLQHPWGSCAAQCQLQTSHGQPEKMSLDMWNVILVKKKIPNLTEQPMEKTERRIWKTSTCVYSCVKKREWEQDHSSSSPQLSLPIPSPPLALAAHVGNTLLKGKADSLADTLNLTQYCPRIKQTLSWMKKDISQTFKSRAKEREWPQCLWF